MEENYFDWMIFYSKFADVLLEYKERRKELAEKIIEAFKRANLKLPKLAKDGLPTDIDPFTLFSLFNRKTRGETKEAIIREIKNVFALDFELPKHYNGIPLINPLNTNFISFRETDERRKEIANELWDFYETVVRFSQNPSENLRNKFIEGFNRTIKLRGVKQKKLTMALYWIKPESFMTLDQNSKNLIQDIDFFSESDKALLNKDLDGENYLTIRDKIFNFINSNENVKNFADFSDAAYHPSDETATKITTSFIQWFKPIINALKELVGEGTKEDVIQEIVMNIPDLENSIESLKSDLTFSFDYLEKSGYIEIPENNLIKLTDKGWNSDMTDDLTYEIYKTVNQGDFKEPYQNTLGDAEVQTVHYWTYSPGEHSLEWDNFYNNGIIALGWKEIGDLLQYDSKKSLRDKLQKEKDSDQKYKNTVHALWQFVHDLKPGDIVFAKKDQNKILGKGIIQSDYLYNEENGDYPNIRKVDWIKKGPWISNDKVAVKTLTDITNYPKLVDSLNNLIGNETEDEETEDSIVQNYPEYSKEKFLKEVYLDEDRYNKLVYLLKSKKNLILQGAPGVGKTYLAKRLAYSIMGEKDISRVEMIQFHQSYSYEDFIMGFRPTATHYDLVPGSFYNFCKKAEEDTENDYFFIIDEINRGNLSKIFGELFMLLENDKRGSKNKLQLLYSNEYFNIPENVYIIGMMNTADRSLALLDFALRRRFGFFDLTPGFDSQGFKNYMDELDSEKFNKLIREIKLLNNDISQDETLGKEFCIGHSFFCNLNSEDLDNYRLESIVEFEIIPLLNEYWFDEPEKVEEWSQNLKKAIQ